ncbi:MAG: ABC transporter ATP-binding protein [Chloroflexota bacterium]
MLTSQQRQLLLQYLGPLWKKSLLLLALLLLGVGLQLANPQIMSDFIDTLGAAGTMASASAADSGQDPLLRLALAFLGVSLLSQLVGVIATYIGEDIGWRTTNALRTDLARHCLGLDMSFHNAHTPGEMIERLDGDVSTLANFFSQLVVRIGSNVLLLIGVLLLLLKEDWRVSLALLAYIGLAFLGLGSLQRIAVAYWEAIRQASADLFGFLEEQLAGTEDIRSNGAEAYVMGRLFEFSAAYLRKALRGVSMNTLIGALWIGLYVAGQAIAFVSGYFLMRAGLITLGAVYLIVYCTHFVFQRLLEVAVQIQDLQQAGASSERIRALLVTESKLAGSPNPAPLPAGPLAVTFDRVTFGYNESEAVLRDVSFHLPAGQTLGLLGRTGSGKTTLTRLVFRLYDPLQGAICLAASENGATPGPGWDIRRVAPAQLCERVGMVTQNVQLFDASVRDNVTFFDAGIPDEKILQAIDGLGLSAWYRALPHGLDSRIDSSGKNLSAGEAQLLAFTRIFLKDPGVIILDEASSRLDAGSERLIEAAIEKLLENRTGIIIAHRLHTVQRADHILILENGKVQEFGRRRDLAHDPASRFSGLLQTNLAEVLA